MNSCYHRTDGVPHGVPIRHPAGLMPGRGDSPQVPLLWDIGRALLAATIVVPAALGVATVALSLWVDGAEAFTRQDPERLALFGLMFLVGGALCVVAVGWARDAGRRLVGVLRERPRPRRLDVDPRERIEVARAFLVGPARVRTLGHPVNPRLSFLVSCLTPAFLAVALCGALCLLRREVGLPLLAIAVALQFFPRATWWLADRLLTIPQLGWKRYVRAGFSIGIFRAFDRSIDGELRHVLAPVLGAYGKIRLVEGPHYRAVEDPWQVVPSGRIGGLGDALGDLEEAERFSDDTWREGVQAMIQEVDLAVIQVDEVSASTLWELATCIHALPPGRVWLCARRPDAERRVSEVLATLGAADIPGKVASHVEWLPSPAWGRALRLRVAVLRAMERLVPPSPPAEEASRGSWRG